MNQTSFFPSDNNGEIGSLVHRVHLALASKTGRCVAFIAARSGDGTSTIARQFAEGLGYKTEQKVLLVDAGALDRERFILDGIDPNFGIVDAIALNHPATKAIHSIEHNVFLCRWVGLPENRVVAGKLLHGKEFWKSLQSEYKTIVIDSPSPQTSSDGIALASQADVTIIVIEAETTRQPVIENLRDTLLAAGANIIGSVMNKRRFYIPEKVYARL